MENEIINRVANSKLKVFDLEDYYPKEAIEIIDISQWLCDGFLLKEKEFRAALLAEDWSKYTNKIVALQCNTDAILPSWAMLLVASYLAPYTTFVFQGSESETLITYYQNTIDSIDFSEFQDQPVIIKGCAKKPVPEQLYVVVINKMINIARSIMFGEACSAVPIHKKKK